MRYDIFKNMKVGLLIILACLFLFVTPCSANTYPQNSVLQWEGSWWILDSANPNITWTDDNGNLHMQIVKKGDGTWEGVSLEQSGTHKYGKASWKASSASLNFPEKTALGMFIYHNDTKEMDIEVDQWPGYDERLWFVNHPGGVDVHPWNVNYSVLSNNTHLNETNITYSIDWQPDHILFSAINNSDVVINEWNYTNVSQIPDMNSTVCLCFLPLAGGYYGWPEGNETKEVVFSDFTYTPY